MKTRYLLLVFLMITGPVYSQWKNTSGIDTPTAYTLDRGMYQVKFLGYDNGGVELKALIGLHDILFLGASFDMQSLIGKDDSEPNVPGVIARLKITDGWPELPLSIAVGYDSFYIGSVGKTENSYNRLNRMIYGPYLVFTNPIYLFGGEQFVSYGIRVPTQPDYVPEDTSYFLCFDIPLGESFRFKMETERVYYNFKRNEDWLTNFGLRYTYLGQLGVEFDVMLQKNEKPNRIIRIIYSGEF
jgi:hypothetical protein